MCIRRAVARGAFVPKVCSSHIPFIRFSFSLWSACAGDLNGFRADGVAGGSVTNDNGSRALAKSGRREGHEEVARIPRVQSVGAIVGEVDVTGVVNGLDDEGSGGDVRQGDGLRSTVGIDGLTAEIEDCRVGLKGVLTIIDGEPLLRRELRRWSDIAAQSSYKNVAA